jgi:hypothetical protein
MLSGLHVRLGYKAFVETKHSLEEEIKMGVDAVADFDFAAFVGIDWAEYKHVVALQDIPSGRTQVGEIEHTPEAVDAWAMELSERYQERPIAIAVEQVRGSLVFMLTKYKHLIIFPIHPATLANYRKSFRPSGAKGDPHDAGLLLDLLTRHREKLRRITPDTAETRTIRFLVEERRKLVNERIRFSQRLNSHLKLYFPQVLNWFCDISSQIAEDFLERWPTLEAVQKARTKTLEQFFADHNSRSPEKIKMRIEEIRRAITATHDTAVITASSAAALALVRILREMRVAISSYDVQIERLAQAHPDFPIFDSFPGAGAAMAPRLSLHSGLVATDIGQLKRFSATAESLPLSNLVESSIGFTIVGLARNSCVRPSTNGRYTRWFLPLGRRIIIVSNAPTANLTTRLSER